MTDFSHQEVPEPLQRQIDEIGEQFLESLREGESAEPKEIASRHPGLSPWLERRLRFLAWMNRLASRSSSASPSRDSEARIHCPHCRVTIVTSLPTPEEMTCENCGRCFRIESFSQSDGPDEPFPKSIQRFRVLQVLGHGSFGVVYRAVDTELGRTVTLKLPRAGYFRGRQEEHRFRREAKSASRLSHPGIVRVYEIAEAGQVPFIVQEYIEGSTLDESTRRDPPSFSRSADLVRQVADALHYAHEHGVVHRDIKPENIIVDEQGRPHITDFGLARQDEGEVTVTLDGQIIGTPAYMSPEQAAGRHDHVGPRSDLYSVGVVLYELLTGERPFTGQPSMVLLQVLHDEPRPLRRLNDNIPRDLETICLKALNKEPSRRYATAGEMRDELKRFLAGEPIRARPVGQVERTWRWCRRNPVVASLSAVITLLVLAVTAGSLITALRFQEKSEEISEALEVRRQQLVRTNVVSGVRIFNRGDFLDSLPHLAEALRHDRGDDDRELPHRIRIASAIARCPRLLHVWLHRGEVSQVAFSPDGRSGLCVSHPTAESGPLSASTSAAPSYGVHVYDMESGPARFPPLPHPLPVSSARFRPDSQRILTACRDGGVRIWDSSTGKLLKRFQHAESCYHAAYHPAGAPILSVGNDGTARLWKEDADEPLRVLRHSGPLDYGTFSPDGRRLAARQHDTVVVWDAESGEKLASLCRYRGDYILHVCFSPDGQRLATASRRGEAALWEAATGRLLDIPLYHGYPVSHVAFSPDGRRLVTTSWRGVRIWDAETGEPLTSWMEEHFDQQFAQFSPDGRYVVSTNELRSVFLWHVESGEPAFQPLRQYRDVRDVAFHPQGHLLLTASRDGMVRLWDLTRQQPTRPPILHDRDVRTLEISADGRYCATSSHDDTARVTDVKTGVECARFEHDSNVNLALFRPGRMQVLTADDEGRAALWDIDSGDRLYSIAVAPRKQPHWAAFDPAGDLLVTSNLQGSVAFRDPATGKPRGEPLRLNAATPLLVFSPDNHLLFAWSQDGNLRMFGLPDRNLLWNRGERPRRIHCAAFDHRSDRLATGHEDGGAWIRDAASGERVVEVGEGRHFDDSRRRMLPHASLVNSVAFSPDDRYLLTASSDGDARVWDARTGEGISEWLRHESIDRARFSADGRWVATVSRDRRGRIWDWRTGDPVLPPLQHDDTVVDIAVDLRGERVLTASFDWTLKVWDIPRDERPAEDLILLAQILSGQRVEGGGLEWLTPQEIEAGWRRLRSRYPSEFSTSESQVAAWHRREVILSVREKDWRGLIWHADRLLAPAATDLPFREKISIRRRRARARAELGKYLEAAEDYREVFDSCPRDFESAYRLAILSAANRQRGTYGRTCGHLLALAQKWDNRRLQQRAVRACLLEPGSVSRGKDLVDVAREAASKVSSLSARKEVGAALYRAGQTYAAILELNVSRAFFPEGEPQLLGGGYLDHLFLAMAYHDQGLESMASECFAKAQKWISEQVASGTTRAGTALSWRNRLRMQILLEEARERLGK